MQEILIGVRPGFYFVFSGVTQILVDILLDHVEYLSVTKKLKN